MAEWSALPTTSRGDSSSIPAQVKTFFVGIKSYHFKFNSNFKFNSIFFN